MARTLTKKLMVTFVRLISYVRVTRLNNGCPGRWRVPNDDLSIVEALY